MSENGHIPLNIPILGQKAVGKAMVGAQLGAIPRKLDGNGQLEADVIMGASGQPVPRLRRTDFLDATEFLQAMREMVREELDRAVETLRTNRV